MRSSLTNRVLLFSGMVGALLCCSWRAATSDETERAKVVGCVNVRDFAERVAGDDWSPAIQAAIDHVNAANGYENGATVLFPPGTYKVNKTILLGKSRSHYGTRLSGYGAVLVGTKTLDAQPLHYEEREKTLTGDYKTALPGELDFNGKNVGVPILELWDPPNTEGAAFVVEGLTFDREVNAQGVGIKIPAETVPKNVTFRDIKVYRQNVGIHVVYAWQIRLESCIIRSNQIGIWGRSHFNSVSIVNSTIRRQHLHGIVIGPNAGSWGSSAIYIAGSIFEETKGYGILNAGGCQVTIVGNYFEMVGNSIGVLSPYGNTIIDGNHFWGGYGHGWNLNKHKGQIVSDKGHVVVSSPGVQMRNNRYGGATPILVFGLSGANCFDALPVAAEGVILADGTRVGDSSGLGAYVYDASNRKFEFQQYVVPTQQEARAEARRKEEAKVAQAREIIASTKSVDERVEAQLTIGRIRLAASDYDAAARSTRRRFSIQARTSRTCGPTFRCTSPTAT